MNTESQAELNTKLNTEEDTELSVESVLTLSSDPINVKNSALLILTTIAIIFVLNWAQSFIITLLLGILLTYALSPLVALLEKIKIPRVVGSTIVILAVIFGIVFSAYMLQNQIQSIIAKLPEAAAKLSSALTTKRGEPLTNMQKVQLAATQVETAATAVQRNTASEKKPAMHVVIEEPKFKLNNFLWRGSLGIFGFIGEVMTMIFLAYFILLSGDTFKRKLVRLTGPSLTQKKITIHILEDINASIQRYMFMLLITNTLVGVFMWIAFRMIGLENAGAWAVSAGFLHLIPYFGPVATAAATGMAAYMQFNSVYMAVLVAGVAMLIATIIGIFITTWMTGRIAKMNSAAVFISLLFFAWLWGVWGMLLGIPIVVIIKVVSERIEQFQPLAELLSE